MRRAIHRFGLTGLFVVATACALTTALVGLSGIRPQVAHAAAMRAHAAAVPKLASDNPCHTTKVVLNGNNPPSISCADSADSTAATSGGVNPAKVTVTGCNTGDLFVYDGYNHSGDKVCFSGDGSVDLTNIPWGLCCSQSWNDRAESYTAGTQSGKFYTDTGDAGTHWIFYPDYTTYNFNAQFTNQASSICINVAAGPNGCPN